MDLTQTFAQYTERSGTGSTLEYTAPYRDFLVDYIARHDVRCVLDLGCGDLTIMSDVMARVGARVGYIGVDCLPARVAMNNAQHGDLYCVCDDVRYPGVPGYGAVDLVICKDVIQHWDTQTVVTWLDAMARFGVPALITNCARGDAVNSDIPMGGWRPLDLARHPFAVGEVVFSWDTKDVVLLRNAG